MTNSGKTKLTRPAHEACRTGGLTVFLLLSLFCACFNNGPNVKKIEPLWTRVIKSQSTHEEKDAIGELKSYISSSRISFKTTVLDAQGKEIAYNDLTPDFQITSVRIQFFTEGGTFEGDLWKLKDPGNLYRLYRE